MVVEAAATIHNRIGIALGLLNGEKLEDKEKCT